MADAAAYQCHMCGKQGQGMKKCSRCHQAYYCNAACQKADWKTHKLECHAPLPNTMEFTLSKTPIGMPEAMTVSTLNINPSSSAASSKNMVKVQFSGQSAMMVYDETRKLNGFIPYNAALVAHIQQHGVDLGYAGKGYFQATFTPETQKLVLDMKSICVEFW
eukprot:m.357831 g.357831  ORF g.357831 m.357831 type:complete len:162 (-) comp17954_c0_seq1:138-623(-)